MLASPSVRTSTARARSRAWVAFAVMAAWPVLGPGCSVGDGSGAVSGVLDVPNCWSGQYSLQPDFFAADTYSDQTVTIRIQNGGDYASFSDGLSILVDNVHEIRGDAPFSPPLLGHPLTVALPSGVIVPGAPIIPDPHTSLVHVTVYLQKSCPTQNVALYALESVSVDANGDCTPAATGPFILACNAPGAQGFEALADASADAYPFPDGTVRPSAATGADASPPSLAGDASAVASEGGTVLPPNAPVRHSTITFQSLFDGNPAESSAAERLTQANFTLYLGDPSDACPGGLGPPPPCRGLLTGHFQFLFERGRPGQAFP